MPSSSPVPRAELGEPLPLSFLSPASIAIIGASNNPRKRGYQALARLKQDGFDESRIYPINLKDPEVLGVKAYASLAEIDAAIDLALICTPAASLPAVIADCGRKGIPGAIVLAAGLSEMGERGRQLEAQMIAAARQWNVRLVGPNTNGVFNLHCDLNVVGVSDVRPGQIGILSQSGNVMLGLIAEAQDRGGIGFSTYIGVGNQSDIRMSEYLEYFGEDPHTAAVVIYVEGFKPGDGRRFLDVARRVVHDKPVVAFKSGRTAAGQVSASSHTGSMAGSYQMSRDVLRQAGVTVIHESDKLLSIADALGKLPLPAGNRVGVLCDSGGHGTITADTLVEMGLTMAGLSAVTLERLRQELPPAAALNNPVDVAGATDEDTSPFAVCADILLSDPGVDVLMLVGMIGAYCERFSPTLRDNEMATMQQLVRVAQRHQKPVVVQSVYAPNQPEPLTYLKDQGIPVFIWVEGAVRAVSELVRRQQACQRLSEDAATAQPPGDDTAAAQPPADGTGAALPPGDRRARRAADIVRAAVSAGHPALLESEAKALLAAHGIQVPAEALIRTPEALQALPAELADVPLAMKIVSRDILHKTDAGGVRLNVKGSEARRQAWQEIMANARTYDPEAHIEGILCAPMLQPGIEVILGMIRDPVFGPVMMFGLGGIYVEVLGDVAFRAIPLDQGDAVEMIAQIAGAKILEGVRGGPPIDRDALVALILQLSRLVKQHPEITEMDLNPVILHPDGYSIADARIILDRGG